MPNNVLGTLLDRLRGIKRKSTDSKKKEAPQATDKSGEQYQYGRVPFSPSTGDVTRALTDDFYRMSERDRRDFTRRLGALSDLEKRLGSDYAKTARSIEQDTRYGTAAVDRGLQRIRDALRGATDKGDTLLRGMEEAIGQEAVSAKKGISEAVSGAEEAAAAGIRDFDRLSGKLDEQLSAGLGELKKVSGSAEGSIERAWQAGAKALSEFRSTIASQMSEWVLGNQSASAAAKEERARQMAAAGYRPEEIQAELRKMDREALREQGRQLATFQTQEELARRELALQYDTQAMETERSMRNLQGQLAGIGAQLRGEFAGLQKDVTAGKAALRQWSGEMAFKGAEAKAQVGMWARDRQAALREARTELQKFSASVTKEAEIAGFDTISRLKMAKATNDVALSQLRTSGWTGLADLHQRMGEAVTPFSPFILQTMGIQMALQDRAAGADVDSLTMVLASLSQLQGLTGMSLDLARGGT